MPERSESCTSGMPGVRVTRGVHACPSAQVHYDGGDFFLPLTMEKAGGIETVWVIWTEEHGSPHSAPYCMTAWQDGGSSSSSGGASS